MTRSAFRLDRRLAVVTGAAGILGPVWIRTLLEAGARVVAFAMPGTERDPSIEALRHPQLTVRAVDVRDRDDLGRAVGEVITSSGAPHVLVASAGVDSPPTGMGETLDSISPESVRAILETNVLGTFQTVQLVGRAMAEAARGSVILIGSVYATVAPDPALYDHIRPPFLKTPAYGASKAAVAQLARHFAVLWGRAGVRVNTLSPGGIQAGQDLEFVRKYADRTPLGRLADRAELAGPLLFLASDASSYVTGANLRVDGGFTQW